MIWHKLQFGSGIAEFIIVAIPVMLLGLAGVELANWLNMRQITSMVLINAGRAASSQNGNPQVIADAFENNLRMAFPDKKSLQRRLNQNQIDLGLPWQIKIISPKAKDFSDHQNQRISLANKTQNQAMINNYYQDLQHQHNLQKGWLQGKGPISGKNIFQANTLSLELIWPQQPLVPGIKQLIQLLEPFVSKNKNIVAAGYLPLTRKISISMQSHPILWPNLADNRVIYADTNNVYTNTSKFEQINCQIGAGINCNYSIPITNQNLNGKSPFDNINKNGLINNNDKSTANNNTDIVGSENLVEQSDQGLNTCDIAY